MRSRLAVRYVGVFILGMLGASVAACGSDGVDEQVHPALHCDGSGSITLEYDVETTGAASIAEAKNGVLDYYVTEFGGTVVELDDRTSALLVGGAVVVVAPIRDAPDGGYQNDTIHLCDDFVPQETGPPDTEPPATATEN